MQLQVKLLEIAEITYLGSRKKQEKYFLTYLEVSKEEERYDWCFQDQNTASKVNVTL